MGLTRHRKFYGARLGSLKHCSLHVASRAPWFDLVNDGYEPLAVPRLMSTPPVPTTIA